MTSGGGEDAGGEALGFDTSEGFKRSVSFTLGTGLSSSEEESVSEALAAHDLTGRLRFWPHCSALRSRSRVRFRSFARLTSVPRLPFSP